MALVAILFLVLYGFHTAAGDQPIVSSTLENDLMGDEKFGEEMSLPDLEVTSANCPKCSQGRDNVENVILQNTTPTAVAQLDDVLKNEILLDNATVQTSTPADDHVEDVSKNEILLDNATVQTSTPADDHVEDVSKNEILLDNATVQTSTPADDHVEDVSKNEILLDNATVQTTTPADDHVEDVSKNEILLDNATVQTSTPADDHVEDVSKNEILLDNATVQTTTPADDHVEDVSKNGVPLETEKSCNNESGPDDPPLSCRQTNKEVTPLDMNGSLAVANLEDGFHYSVNDTYNAPMLDIGSAYNIRYENVTQTSSKELNEAIGVSTQESSTEKNYSELKNGLYFPFQSDNLIFDADSEMLADSPSSDDMDSEGQPGASLAFIFDSTGSMFDELNQVKVGAGQILEALLTNKEIVIHDFILVPFKDPEIGPVSVTTDPKKFQSMIDTITVSGGEDCPEASMTAIEKALELARPNSYFYVFTDADAKDKHLLNSVLSLIQQKQGQVFFILTGTCDGVEDYTGSGVYQRVADASSGQVYHLKKQEVKEVLKYVKVALKHNKVNLISVKLPAPPPHTTDNHTVVVDKDLSEFTISVAGKDAGITVTDPHGIIQTGTNNVKPLLNLTNVKVVNVKEPDPGPWQVGVESKSEYSLRATGLSDVSFRHGFSTVPDVDIGQTNLRPLHGSNCYLLIQIPDSAVHNLTFADIESLNGTSVLRLAVVRHATIPGLFVSQNFTPPGPTEFFHLGITGFSNDGSPIRRVTSTAISASYPEKPRIAMKSKTIAKVRSKVRLSCNVTSLVPFTVQWFHGDIALAPPTNHTQTCQVMYEINQVTEASEGNYTCSATNVAGKLSQSTVLIATGDRPFVTTVPSRKIIAEVGASVEIPCSVLSGFTVTNVFWKRIDVTSVGAGQLKPVLNKVYSNNSLIMGNLSETDEGWYTCTATNRKGAGSSRIFLNVRHPLRVNVTPTNMSFTRGQSVTLVCRVSGNPSSVEWRRDLITITDNTPFVYLEDVGNELRLLLNSLDENRAGVYSCYAFKNDETEHANAELFYTEKPVVTASAKSITVMVGTHAEFTCNATGVPEPLISWRRGTQVLHTDEHYLISNGSLIISEVSDADAGEITCVARNTLGDSEDHVWLAVGTPPMFIQKPRDKKIMLGHNGTIICSVMGSPQPEVSWSREGSLLDEHRSRILPGGRLHITHVQITDAGTYICTASNSFGNVTAATNITVSGIKKPSVDKGISMSKVQAESGGAVSMPCGVALGNPPGTVTWLRDQQPVDRIRTTIMSDGRLELHSAVAADDGVYTCVVSSPVGNASRTFQLTVLEEPHASSAENHDEPSPETVVVGRRIVLMCPITGNPRPKISWTKSGTIVATSSTVYQDKDGNLVLDKVNESQGGNYVCTGTNELGSTSLQIPLDVHVAPTLVTSDALPNDKKHEVVEGYTAVLNCKMHGVPTPRVSWFKNGAPLTVHVEDANSQVLRFVVTLEDNGTYKCIVTNIAGSASKEFELSVLVPPRIADAGDEPVSARAGESAELTCGVTGVPEPVVLWRRNGIYLTQNSTDTTLIGHKLLLNNVSEESSGTYTCDAENTAGIAQQTFYLHVTFGPRFVETGIDNNTITVREGEELSLKCSAEGSPMPEMSWLRNGELLHQYLAGVLVLNDQTLLFVQVRADHAGMYTCRANNSEGDAERNYQLVVTSPPGLLPDADQYTLMEVNEGDNLTLTCPTSGLSYNVHWLKNGKPLVGPLKERSDEPQMKLSGDKRQLVLPEAHPADSGNYSCVATNPAGRVDAAFLVAVLMTPHFEEFNHVAHRTVLVGGNVSLNCSVSGNPPPQVSWKKDIYPIVPGRPAGVVLSRDQHHLVIPNARIYHSGTYICIAANKLMIKEREFYITVLEPPSIPGDIQEDVELLIGSRLALECPAGGEPRPQITWYADNCDGTKRALNVTDSVLVLEEVDVNHTTVFYCEAESTAGTAAKTFNVTVLAAPIIKDNDSLENVQVREGDDLSLRCRVKGVPRPHVTWLHNGVEVDAARRRRRDVSFISSSDVENVEVLQLSHVDREAQGLYTAVASNRAGHSEKNFKVQVAVAPKRTKIEPPESSVVMGRTAELVCPVEASPSPNITWYRLGSELKPDGLKYSVDKKSKLVIENTSTADTGNYTCRASNPAGSVVVDMQLIVLQPPWFPEGNKDVFTSTTAGNLTLNCSAVGFPFPTISWLRGLQLLPYDGSTLVISGLSVKDADTYTCLASNEAGAAEKYFIVDVVEPPVALSSIVPTIRVQLYRRLQLNCESFSRSPFNITWYKVMNESSRAFLGEGKDFINPIVNGSDGGVYECQAENVAGAIRIQSHVNVYVQASWQAWSSWSECSVSCGGGVATRHRNCSHGLEFLHPSVEVDKTLCVGSGSENEKCAIVGCQIDGGWSKWSNWSDCSVSCGNGTKHRFRSCDAPEPSNGGQPCVGISSEFASCNVINCPGIWSPWSDWSECSKSCGNGERSRWRNCLGSGDCLGSYWEKELCNTEPCRKERKRGRWSPWSECSKTCGTGLKKRVRRCNARVMGGKACEDNVEFEPCYIMPCAADLSIIGHLNGRQMNSRVFADLSDNVVTARTRDFSWLPEEPIRRRPPQEHVNPYDNAKWYPYAPILLAPIAWNVANEEGSAANGFSLTGGRFLSKSNITFATGEKLTMHTDGQGADSKGTMKVTIEVIGEAPIVEPNAAVYIKTLNQDFVQVADDALMGHADDVMMINDAPVPFHVNTSIKYNSNQGKMPYLVEKLSMKEMEHIMPGSNGLEWRAAASVSMKYDSNVCPPGYQHDHQHHLCQDIDECLEGPCRHNQECTNTWGSYSCSCREGYTTGPHSMCSDRNECEEDQTCQHSCVNTEGSYYCLCSMGYTLGSDGSSCLGEPEEDRDYENVEQKKTNENVISEDWSEPQNQWPRDAPSPACMPGFVFDDNYCQDVDECLLEGICGADGLCLNMRGSYQCLDVSCPSGFLRQTPSTCTADCHLNPCKHGSITAEAVVYALLSLKTKTFRPLEDLLQLRVQGFNMTFVTAHRARVIEGHALRLRTDNDYASLYAPTDLKPNTFYRVVAVVESFGLSDRLLYTTEFVVFVLLQ